MGENDFFYRDLDRYNAAFTELDAVVTYHDGEEEFMGIDQAKVPTALLGGYQLLLQYGAANGLLPLEEPT